MQPAAGAPPFVALIPARLASTRLPRKALADIGGLPMVVRVAGRARAAGAQQVVVCTDAEDILAACREHAVAALLTSPHHETGTDRLAEACAALALPPATLVVNVQGDEPLIPPDVIARVAQRLADCPDCEIATAAHPLTGAREFHDPNVVKVVFDEQQRALLFSRAPIPWDRDRPAGAAGAPEAAWRHVGLYAYRAGFLARYPGLAPAPIERLEKLEQLRAQWHGVKIAVLPLAEALPHGVDTPADLERMRRLFA